MADDKSDLKTHKGSFDNDRKKGMDSPVRDGGFFGFVGGLFNRRPETPEEREKREEDEYTKEMKKRTRAKNINSKRDKLLRPVDRSESASERFYTQSGEDKPKNKAPTIVVDKLEDLPPDIHGSIERMKVSEEELKANFEVFLNVLSFTDKHMPRRRLEEKRREKKRKEKKRKEKKTQRQRQRKWSFIHSLLSRFLTTGQKEARKKQKQDVLPSISDRIKLSEEKAYETMTFTEARRLYKWDTYLGHGGFGQVVEAKSKEKRDPAYNDKVAIKFQANDGVRSESMNLDEVSVLQFCDHPNVVTMYRAIRVRTEVWMIMELLRGGTLKQASTNKGVPFAENEIAYVAREMLKGIKYIHDNQLAHRDLKNLNIMLTVEGGIKLIDFGLALDMTLGPRVQMVGSPLWMPPEMIQGKPHSYGVDVWSFTVCMLELANQKPPNASNIKRAMFLSATRGMGENEDKFTDASKWSEDFLVCFVLVLGVYCVFSYSPPLPSSFRTLLH